MFFRFFLFCFVTRTNTLWSWLVSWVFWTALWQKTATKVENSLFFIFYRSLHVFKTLVWLPWQQQNWNLISFRILTYCVFRKHILYVAYLYILSLPYISKKKRNIPHIVHIFWKTTSDKKNTQKVFQKSYQLRKS